MDHPDRDTGGIRTHFIDDSCRVDTRNVRQGKLSARRGLSHAKRDVDRRDPGGSDLDADFTAACVRLGKRADGQHLGGTEPVKLDCEHAHLSELDDKFRTFAQIEELFDGLELVEPGVVLVPDWRPDPGTPGVDDHPVLRLAAAGVARQP